MQEDRPDAVLLDLHLATVQGDALLEFIRESDQHLPVVILSSKNNPDDITRLGELGANGFIRKPFETDDLLVVIEQIMADLATVSTDASQPDELEEDETRSSEEDTPSLDITPGAGIHDLRQQPAISPLEQTTAAPPRRRRTHQKHEQGRSRSTRLRKLRNYVLAVVFFILLGFVLYIMREGLNAGFLGITIN